MASLSENIQRAINNLDSIQEAIIEKGVEVPDNTPAGLYADKIREIETYETNDTLPLQITDFTATGMVRGILINFTEVSDAGQKYLKQYNFVYKEESIPSGVSDGTMITFDKEGGNVSRTVCIYGLQADKHYYIRSFPGNYKNQYQTMMPGAVADAITLEE